MRACRLVCAVLTVGLVTAPLYAQKPRDAQKEIRLIRPPPDFDSRSISRIHLPLLSLISTATHLLTSKCFWQHCRLR